MPKRTDWEKLVEKCTENHQNRHDFHQIMKSGQFISNQPKTSKLWSIEDILDYSAKQAVKEIINMPVEEFIKKFVIVQNPNSPAAKDFLKKTNSALFQINKI